MQSRLKKFSVYFVLDGIQKASAIFLIPVYTAYMSPEQYGILSVCMSICLITPIVLFANIYEAAYFSVLKNEEGCHDKVRKIILFEALVVLIVTFVVVFAHVVIPEEQTIFGIRWFPYIFYTMIMSALSVFPLTVNQVLLASEQVKKYTIFSFLCFVSSVSLILVLLICFDLGAMSFVFGNTIVYLAVALFIVVSVFRAGTIRVEWREIAPLLKFSSPLVPHNLAHWLRSWVDRLFLSWFVSPASTGLLHISVTYGNVLTLGIDAFRNANNPRFFSLINESESSRQITVILPISMGVFSFVALGLSLYSREILGCLVDKAYYDAYRYVPFILTSNLLFLIYINIVNVLFNSCRTWDVSVTTMLSAIFSILLSAYLVSNHGILGAAISMVGSCLFMSLIVYIKCQKITRLPWPIVQAALLSLVPLLALVVASWSSLEKLCLLFGVGSFIGIIIYKDVKAVCLAID